MRILLACALSSILIVFLMGITKYRWTRPPLAWMVAYFLAGVASTVPAIVLNGLINLETRFSMASPILHENAVGFALGPGMGEEFFKFSLGLLVTLMAAGWNAPLSPASRLQGFVLVGLGFAVVENIFYAGSGITNLLLRNLLPVPMHAAMGFIQGSVVNHAILKGRNWLILAGYFLCMGIHWIYDVALVNGGPVVGPIVGSTIVLALVITSIIIWWATPEFSTSAPGPIPAARPGAPLPSPSAP